MGQQKNDLIAGSSRIWMSSAFHIISAAVGVVGVNATTRILGMSK
jgi:hypothetical protein